MLDKKIDVAHHKERLSMDVHRLILDFLEHLEVELNVSKLTIRNYRHYLNRFAEFLGSSLSPTVKSHKKNISISHISSDTIRSYRLYLARHTDARGRILSRATQNYHLIALRSFLKYLAKRDIDALAPVKIDLSKSESSSIRFLEREDIERLLNMPGISSLQGLRDKAILEVLFSTGLRVSELVSLNRDQWNFERKEVGIRGKGMRPLGVFRSDRAAYWLERYLAAREDHAYAMFIRYSGKTPPPDDPKGEGLRLTSRSVQRLVKRYVKKAKIPIEITPHGIRHSFATDLLTGGADLRAIQEMLGHKNISTTQVYTHVTNPQLKKIHATYHNRQRKSA